MFIKALNILLARTKDGRSPIYPGSVVEVEDSVGQYFVEQRAALEMARPATRAANPAPATPNPGEKNQSQNDNAPEGPSEGETEDVDLNTLSYNQLKAMAQEMGIETGKIKSKSGMIDAITTAQLDPGDDLPDLTPMDVVD